MFGFLRKLFWRRFATSEAVRSRLAPSQDSVTSQPTLAVGDMVIHPLRNAPTPVLAVGNRVWQFVSADEHANPAAFVQEVIEGSPEFHLLRCMRPMYRGAFVRTEPSVEIDNTHDIERKVHVAAMASLYRLAAEELAEHDRKRITHIPESDAIVELPEAFVVDLRGSAVVKKK